MVSHIPSDKSSKKSGSATVLAFAKPGSDVQLPCDVEPTPDAALDALVALIGTAEPKKETLLPFKTPEQLRQESTLKFVLDSLEKTTAEIKSGEMPVEAFFMGVVSDINAEEPTLNYVVCGANRLEMLGVLHDFMEDL